MKRLLWMLAGFAMVASAQAALHTETVEYKHGDTTLKGYLAYDTAVKGKRPGVLVVHEWWGLNAYAKRRADMLAQLGYVAFAADMYGDGFNTTSPDEAGKHSSEFRTNRPFGRERLTAALNLLRKHETLRSETRRGDWLLFRRHVRARTGAQRRGHRGRREFSRFAEHAQSRRREEHQVQGVGLPRGE